MRQILRPSLALILVVATALSCLLQLFCYRFDNKYTYTRPEAENGHIRLNMEWYDSNPFFYLVEGWAFYDNKLLTPDTVREHVPEEYFYIGRYGGLNRKDMSRSGAGQATYRLVIETDEIPRAYSLELAGVYDRWRLYINGHMVQSVGYPDRPFTVSSGSVVTFTAVDKIELLVAVEAEGRGFYSGMVYPPALGSPDRIAYTAHLRLVIHVTACAVALVIALLCLLLAFGRSFAAPYAWLSLLSLCFCGTAAWPLYREGGMAGGIIVWERVCYYGIFLSLILIQNHICRVPKKISRIAAGGGILVCCAIALRPLLPFPTAAVNLSWSHALTAYKWFTALYLLFAAGWAVTREIRHSRSMLAGNCAFAAALVMNRLLPIHEPVLLGWNVEVAAFWWICLLVGVIVRDGIGVYRERTALEIKQALSATQLAAQMEHARLQQEYVRLTRESLHESRSRLTLIRHYLEQKEYGKLTDYLEQLVRHNPGADSLQYTGNSLIDAIFTIQLSRAEEMNVYVEPEFGAIPDPLSMEDGDVTSLLMNVTNNALEALERIEDPVDRWMRLRLELKEECFKIECENATVAREKQVRRSDWRAHGFGLSIMRSIADKYNGEMMTEPQEDSFLISLSLFLSPTGNKS